MIAIVPLGSAWISKYAKITYKEVMKNTILFLVVVYAGVVGIVLLRKYAAIRGGIERISKHAEPEHVKTKSEMKNYANVLKAMVIIMIIFAIAILIGIGTITWAGWLKEKADLASIDGWESVFKYVGIGLALVIEIVFALTLIGKFVYDLWKIIIGRITNQNSGQRTERFHVMGISFIIYLIGLSVIIKIDSLDEAEVFLVSVLSGHALWIIPVAIIALIVVYCTVELLINIFDKLHNSIKIWVDKQGHLGQVAGNGVDDNEEKANKKWNIIRDEARDKLIKIVEYLCVDILLGSLLSLVTYIKFIPDFLLDAYELMFEDEESEDDDLSMQEDVDIGAYGDDGIRVTSEVTSSQAAVTTIENSVL